MKIGRRPVGGDMGDLDGSFPPIYLVCLLPGVIHIDDAASMKLDAET